MDIAAIVSAHLDSLREPHVTSDPEPHAYASEAGKCSRAIGFRVAGVPPTEELDLTGKFAMWLGRVIHQMVQDAITAKYPTMVAEAPWRADGVSGRADLSGGLSIEAPLDEDQVSEIKTIAPFGFEKAVTGTRGAQPEGPDRAHVLQGMLSAHALGIALVEPIYVNKAAGAGKPVFHSWEIPYDVKWQGAVQVELERLRGIVAQVKNGHLPPRIFEGEIITNPGLVKWPCDYCPWLGACVELPSGEVDESYGWKGAE